MLKQGLEQKQQQKLSPLQIQTIRLIETPLVELEQAVRKELDDNFAVEEDRSSDKEEAEEPAKDVSIDEMKDDSDIPSYNLHVNNWGKDARPEYNTFSVKESFSQSLLDQLGFRQLSQHEYEVGKFIIGSLDEDGFLHRDAASLVDDLAFRANIQTDEEEIERLLAIIQEFEPAGVGARDLRECLLLQLRACEQTDDVRHAETILRDFFPELASKHYARILSKMSLSKEELRTAIVRISKLNPKPGGQVDDSYSDKAQQVVPDFVLDLTPDGKLNLTMPRFPLPEIKVKKTYADILNDAKASNDPKLKPTVDLIKEKINSAKWFVEALKQRHNTLQTTMQAILDFQHDYFIDGDESKLKPMVLKDIAQITGFDISTISRVVSSKYIETHFGIFPLKSFFSEGLENQDGEEVSTRRLKNTLQELVDAEDKSKPLTDDQLVTEMSARGFKVARRTIAKYRDQLGIAKARLRKEL